MLKGGFFFGIFVLFLWGVGVFAQKAPLYPDSYFWAAEWNQTGYSPNRHGEVLTWISGEGNVIGYHWNFTAVPLPDKALRNGGFPYYFEWYGDADTKQSFKFEFEKGSLAACQAAPFENLFPSDLIEKWNGKYIGTEKVSSSNGQSEVCDLWKTETTSEGMKVQIVQYLIAKDAAEGNAYPFIWEIINEIGSTFINTFGFTKTPPNQFLFRAPKSWTDSCKHQSSFK